MKAYTIVVLLALTALPLRAQKGFSDPEFGGLTPLPGAPVQQFLGDLAKPVPAPVTSALQHHAPGHGTMIDWAIPLKSWGARERADAGMGLDPEAHLKSYLERNKTELLAGEQKMANHPASREHVKSFAVAVQSDEGSLSPEAKIQHVLAAARDMVRMKEIRLGRPLTPEEKAELYVELKLISARLTEQVNAGNVMQAVKMGSLSSNYNFPQEYPNGLQLTRRYNPTQVIEYAFRTDSYVKVAGKVRTANDFKCNLMSGVIADDLATTGNPAYANIRAALLANRLVKPQGSVTRTVNGSTASLNLPGSSGAAAEFTRQLEAAIFFQAVSKEGQTYHYEGAPAPAATELALLPNPFSLMPADLLVREKQVYWSRDFTSLDHDGLAAGKAKYTFVSIVNRGGGFGAKGYKCARLDGEVYDAQLKKVGRCQTFIDVNSGAIIEESADVTAQARAANGDAIEVHVAYTLELGRLIRPGTNPGLVPQPVP